jgi:hypothetical protein
MGICAFPLAYGAQQADPVSPRVDARIVAATDGIFEAFGSYPLVGIGEMHGVAQVLDYYGALISDSRFAAQVGHVVVEFGGAARQHTLDRYLNGEPVAYSELREVWNQTVGAQPTILNEGYALFFAQVRAINQQLPAEKRIKVWLGEPPIDWSQVRSADAYRTLLDTRDSHAAALIQREILQKGRKALVIYGSAHFDITQSWEHEARALTTAADPGGPMSGRQDATLRDLIEATHPGSLFVVHAYRGFANAECMKNFEQRMVEWPMPAIATPVAGTTLEQDMRKCLAPRSLRMRFPESVPADVQQRVLALVLPNAERDNPLLADSVLFVARGGELTRSPVFLEFVLDEEWRAELDRRNRIIVGRPLPADWIRQKAAVPGAYIPRD